VDGTLKAALQLHPTTFIAVSIALPGGTVRLLSGGQVTFDGNLYSAWDGTYGSLLEVATVSDGSDGQATRLEITLAPPAVSAMTTLSAPAAQGSLVQVWLGAVNEATGVSIGTPDLLFRGELDRPRLAIGGNAFAIIIECGTEEGRLLERNEERTLCDAFHQSIWPGEKGLEYAVRLPRKIYWRASDPATAGVKPRISRLSELAKLK